MNHTLVLFTNHFPYGNSEPFLETEVEHLAQAFSKVIICPRYETTGKRITPDNVETRNIFSATGRAGKLKLYMKGAFLLMNNYTLLRKIKLLNNFHVLGTVKSIKYLGIFGFLKKDLEKFLQSSRFSFENTIFYTYWLGHVTFALGLMKQKTEKIKLVSRAHGYDLYEERGEKSFTFIKRASLTMLDQLYCISEHGRNYLSGKYPELKFKISVSRLGTKDPGFVLTQGSSQNFKIVSCSAIKKVKRLDRIIKALGAIKENRLNIKIEWHHIGDGPELESIKTMAERIITQSNISWKIHGFIPNNELFHLYQKLNPDVFINVSESEGLPVSIMEAQSIGLPVIATDVGGTNEIINQDNGVLLSEYPEIDEVSDAIIFILENNNYLNFKEKSRLKWEQSYNAQYNYPNFASKLHKLCK